MKITRISVWSSWTFFAPLICIGWLLSVPTPALAQCNNSTGFNTVYGNCRGTATTQGSFAMVDATQFGTSSTDICTAIANILATYNPTSGGTSGIVIDARGFASTGLTCNNGGVSPWSNVSGNFASVILLPAGTIALYETLKLPTNSKLVGAGSGSTTFRACTTATGCSSNFSGSDMIDMGLGFATCDVSTGKAPDYPAVVIEHLALNANHIQNLNGIVNDCAQELSSVNDVALANFAPGGIGLWLNDHSDNSGPYANISYSGSGRCAQIFNSSTNKPSNLNQTRGIHGLTCAMSGSENAIYLDAPNNSLEDVYISGGSTQDGILIGSQANAYNNVIFNVRGSGLRNVIHICGTTTCGATPYNVTDLTILGVGVVAGSGDSIEDDLTNMTLPSPYVGMYILGEQVEGGSSSIGYSRFTTSPNGNPTVRAATWLVGSKPPTTGACAAGSLYSCTDGSNCNTTGELYTLWGCQGSGGWKGIR
jgi:hypothetical protein